MWEKMIQAVKQVTQNSYFQHGWKERCLILSQLWYSRKTCTLQLTMQHSRLMLFFAIFLSPKTKDREVDFDVETAIKVCRSAGYYQHALYLAEQHNQHDWYLKIQLEDIQDYQKALDYIGRLDFDEVCRSFYIFNFNRPCSLVHLGPHCTAPSAPPST